MKYINPERIVLGTANLNMNYGLNNQRLTKKKFYEVLKYSSNCGIKEIDTAEDYNNSNIIKEIINKNSLKFNINTKLNINLKRISLNEFKNIQLKIEKMPFIPKIIFFHNQNFLTNINNYFLIKKKINQIFPKIKLGVSIYDKNNLKYISSIDDNLIIQYPLNPLIENLTDYTNKKLIHYTRSIFLQGLLLQNHKFKNKNLILNNIKNKFDTKLKKLNINKFDYLVNYAYQRSKFNKIIVGFENIQHIERILNVKLIEIDDIDFNLNNDEKLYCDPRNWT